MNVTLRKQGGRVEREREREGHVIYCLVNNKKCTHHLVHKVDDRRERKEIKKKRGGGGRPPRSRFHPKKVVISPCMHKN